MPTTRGSISALLSPQYRQVYFEAGKERPLEYPLIFNVSDMEWNPVTDQQVAGLGTMPTKNEGAQFTLDAMVIGHTKSYTAVAYGLAVEITFEAWRDELYGALQEMIKGLSRAARYKQETTAWAVINNAFTAGTGFDSATLCATSHTRLDGGTSANRPSPEISFSVTGIQAGIANFESMVNERGLPQLMSPTTALVHPVKKFIAREILGSGGVPYKSDNEINALIAEDLGWMIGHYLSSQTAWFLVAAKGVHDVNYLWRDYEIFDMFDDPRTKNAVATAYQRFAAGFAAWRGWYGSTG